MGTLSLYFDLSDLLLNLEVIKSIAVNPKRKQNFDLILHDLNLQRQLKYSSGALTISFKLLCVLVKVHRVRVCCNRILKVNGVNYF